MTITVNGQPHELEPHSTVASLLERLGLSKQPCAVEVNRALVTKSKHDLQTLHEGDQVEVVTLVGGG